MADPKTTDTVTNLSAVNSILGAIGQAPLSKLDFSNPEVSYIFNILKDTNRDVQDEGWTFNTEKHYKLAPDGNNEIKIPDNMLRMDVSDGRKDRTTNVIRRGGKLYDKVRHSYSFSGDQYLDIVWLFKFEDVPSVFQRYIISRSAARAAAQLVSSPDLTQMLSVQEANNRAACIEYECNQGDYSFLGWPEESVYTSYQPYTALSRHA